MGVLIKNTYGAFGNDVLNDEELKSCTVLNLAKKALEVVLNGERSYSHLIAVTSCPDAIAPSLGQCINEYYHSTLSSCHTIDIVQGCAGGVTALILASQLCEATRNNILVVTSDAAQKATCTSSEVYHVFKNGVFGCYVSYTESPHSMIHYKSRQYKGLHNVVTVGLGHDADEIITGNIEDMMVDSRRHLGLKLNNGVAIKLMKEAEAFYLDFISVTDHPDILILHQVNELIINHLQHVFSKYPIRFINVAKETGNCGCATTGIVLDILKDEVKNKRVMICSFGTGGVITAGLWQF